QAAAERTVVRVGLGVEQHADPRDRLASALRVNPERPHRGARNSSDYLTTSHSITSLHRTGQYGIARHVAAGAANALDQAASDWIAAYPCHDRNCRSRLLACER